MVLYCGRVRIWVRVRVTRYRLRMGLGQGGEEGRSFTCIGVHLAGFSVLSIRF